MKEIFRDNSKAEIVCAAAGNRNGSTGFYNTQSSSVASVLKPLKSYSEHYRDGDFRVVGSETVPMRTLDDILASYGSIGLLKVDVQGFDYEVFQGATNVLQRTHLILLEICYQPHYKGEAGFKLVNDLLYDAGFELKGVPEPAISKTNGLPLWADAIYQKMN